MASSRSRLLLAATLVLTGAVSCARRDIAIDETRARAHIDMLAATIGSRPVGSPASARARQYLIDELGRDGFAVRVQQADGVDARAGVTTRVANLIAVRDGPRRDAIALTAHYDSVPQAPGAVDDALGVAVCLEAARALGRLALRHSLFVLLTDGEEVGLMGARALVKDPDVTARMRAFLNFDGPGGAGLPLLFEVAPGKGDLLAAWRGSGAPAGASFAVEIYKRLPNDTDFSVFKTGAAGLNFAPLGDAYVYHTDRDVSRRVASSTLRREIETTVDTVRALDATELAGSSEAPTFFDLAGSYGVEYGPLGTRVVAWTASLGAVVVWLLLTRRLWRIVGWRGLVLNVLWSAASAGGAAGAIVGAARLLRAVRAEVNPWYAAPHWFYALMAAAGLTAMWLVGRLATLAPSRARPPRTPAVIWWMTLPVWTALTMLLQTFAPSGSFLLAWPTCAAAICVIVSMRSATAVRLASAAVLAIVAVIWTNKLATMAAFVVPLSGWLGVVMPVSAFAALVVVGGVMYVPPSAALVAGWREPRRPVWMLGAALPLCLALSAWMAYVAPAYTGDRPERRTLRYVQDDMTRQAWWGVASQEPRPALGLAMDGANWQRATDDASAPIRIPLPGGPFRFRSSSAPLAVRPPADIRSTVSSLHDGHRVLDISIAPHEDMTVRVVLPKGRAPVASTWPGRVVDGEWSATYVAPPLSGVDLQLTLDDRSVDALPFVAVVLTVPGLPHEVERATPLPSLAGEVVTWDARSIYVVDARPR